MVPVITAVASCLLAGWPQPVDVPQEAGEVACGPSQGADFVMYSWDMYVVPAGTHTLLFPFSSYNTNNQREKLPFVLIVRHEGNIIVEPSFPRSRLLFSSATPLKIRTADAAITARMLKSEHRNIKAESAASSRPAHSWIMRFSQNSKKCTDFQLDEGRVFLVAIKRSNSITIQQLQTEIIDTRRMSEDEIEVAIGRWWACIQRCAATTKCLVQLSPVRRGQARPFMHRSCKRWHYRLSRSNPATTCQDTVSAAPEFVEPTRLHHEARGVDYRGPFVVDVDDYVLVFPVIKDDEFRVPRSIPFLLAVKRPRNARVISTIAFSVTAPHRVHATGNLYTGRVPRIALDYAIETLGAYFPDTGEYWPDSNEQRTAYDEEMELAVSLTESGDAKAAVFDLQKGRVFLLASDSAARALDLTQVRIDLSAANSACIGMECRDVSAIIAGVVSWWKATVDYCELFANEAKQAADKCDD